MAHRSRKSHSRRSRKLTSYNKFVKKFAASHKGMKGPAMIKAAAKAYRKSADKKSRRSVKKSRRSHKKSRRSVKKSHRSSKKSRRSHNKSRRSAKKSRKARRSAKKSRKSRRSAKKSRKSRRSRRMRGGNVDMMMGMGDDDMDYME